MLGGLGFEIASSLRLSKRNRTCPLGSSGAGLLTQEEEWATFTSKEQELVCTVSF